MLQNSYDHFSINNPIGETASGNSESAIASENQERFTHWFKCPFESIYKKNNDDKSWLTAKFPVNRQQIWEKWENPQTLIGLRFGKETNYGLIDIDYGSQHHNEAGLTAIKGALENFGINDTILLRSSFSEGFHLYYFLPGEVNSYSLACLTAIALKEAGLEVKPGQLEIFPNVKSYSREKPTAFNGHRLPLQPESGSYPLDDDLNPYWYSLGTFLNHADQCALSVDFDLLSELLETARDRYKELFKKLSKGSHHENLVDFVRFKKGKKVKQWETETASIVWTSHGETNLNLKAITDKGRVFLGIDDESELAAYIVKTAIAAPGYFEFCRHQNEIEAWAKRWARWGMKKRYPYGTRNGSGKPKNISKGGPTNEEKKVDAMTRISEAMIDLIASGRLPNQISELRSLLSKLARCSEKTLSKKDYLTLWHPKHRNPDTVKDSEFRSHPSYDCLGVEKELLIIPILEGSDRVIMKSQTTENQTQENERSHENQSPEINFARFSTLKMPKPPTQQAIKPRQDTEKTVISLVVSHAALEVPKNEILQPLKHGDLCYHVDRPKYVLKVISVVNPELVRCLTIGFKGAELFAVCELVLVKPAIAS